MVLPGSDGYVSQFGVAEFSSEKDVLVEFDAIGYFGLILETGHKFKVAFLVREFKFNCAVIFFIFNDVGVGEVFIGEFMPEQDRFLKLYGHFEIFAAFFDLYEEELVFDVGGGMVRAKVDLTAWV